MVIRPADPTRDGPACAAIYEPHVEHSAVSFEENPPSPEEFTQRIERVTRTHPWLVAEEDGRVVGYAYGSRHRERASYRWSTDVAVYIAESHQRRGVGRALYGELLSALTRQGFFVACAGVTLPNQASVGLHERLGFRPVGTYRGIAFKLGAWRDVGWWQLQLQPPTVEQPPDPGPPQSA
jgi:phosphinothricin acetyltransferase